MNIATGCTPINRFYFPYRESEIAVLYITYVQNGETVLEKTKADCTFGEDVISVQLSQADTLRFMSGVKGSVQIRFRRTDNTAGKSDIMYYSVDELLKGGEI